MNVSVPDSSGVVVCNLFIWDILYPFLIKNPVVFCVPTTPGTWISFPNHMNRKVVGGKHNVLRHFADASAPNPSSVVLCNTFKWDILWFISDRKSYYFYVCHNSKTNLIPQPIGQKSCRRQTQCSSILCGCFCSWPIWCCPMEPFQMRYFVVHFWSKILLFLCVQHHQNKFYSTTTGTK